MTFTGLAFAVLTALATAQEFDEQASHNAKECVQKDGVYWGLTRQMFMDQFMGSIENSINEELNRNPAFRREVTQATNCQFTCMAEVFFESAKVIHGSKLLLPEHRAIAKTFVNYMLTGAIKTCYPSSDFNATVATSEKILDAMVEPIVGVHPKAPVISRICPGHPDDLSPTAYTGYQQRFRQCMDSTLEDAKYAKIAAYVRGSSGYGFECQLTCFQNAGQLAFQNLFKTGIFGSAPGHQLLVESMTGATRACFPTVHRPQVLTFWQDVISCMSHSAPKNQCLPIGEKLAVDGEERDVAAFVDEAENAAKCAVNDVAASNPRVKKLIMDAGSCQFKTCFPAMLKTSAHTLFRTKLIIAPDQEEYKANVIAGAIKACYPTVEQDDAMTTARKISEAMGKQQGGACESLEPTAECPGKPEGGNEADFKAIIASLPAKMDAVRTSNKFVQLNNWLHQNSFDCQKTCIHENMASTLTNLWTAGLFAQAECHANLASAFDGVLQSCYPRIPAGLTQEFADACVDLVNENKMKCGGKVNRECIAPSQRVPAAGNINQAEFVEGFTKAADVAFDKMSEKTPGLLKIVEEKGDCQLTCFKDVVTEGAKTIWGTQLLFGKQLVAKRMSASLTGAVSACYPGLPAESTANIAAYIIDQTKDMDYPEAQKVVHGTPPAIETKITSKACPGKPANTDKDDYVQFIKNFGDSFQAALKRPEFTDLEKHVQSGSYTCQESCLNQVIAKSMQTLWQSGLFGSAPNHAMFINAFTGAVRTCFPELTLEKVHTLATQSLTQLEADENQRKYNAEITKQQTPAKAEASIGYGLKFFLGAAGASVALVAVLLVVRSTTRASDLRRDLMLQSGSESFSQLDRSLENGGLE